MKKFAGLFLIFLKIGAFTFGGGYAMVALLENEFVSRRGWLNKEEFLDMTAIAESTPGPLAVNAATYLGYRLAGVAGAAICTFAVCLPSFLILYLISLFFDRFLSLTYVAYAFRGIQVCVVYLILSAGFRMFRSLEKTVFNLVLLSSVMITMVLFSIFSVSFSSVFYILICGTIGVAVYLVHRAKSGNK